MVDNNLTAEELAWMHQHKVEFAGDELWEKMKGFTFKWAGEKAKTTPYDLEELNGIAHVAFAKALNSFDYAKGNKFVTLYGIILSNDFAKRVRDDNLQCRSLMQSVSLYVKFGKDEDDITLLDTLGQEDDVTITNLDFEVISQAVDYALRDTPKQMQELFRKVIYIENKPSYPEMVKIFKEQGYKVSRGTVAKKHKEFTQRFYERYQLIANTEDIIEMAIPNSRKRRKTV